MDQPAGAAEHQTQQVDDTSIPSTGQVIARALPAAAVAIIGYPALAWFLPHDADALPEPWWLLAVIAIFGLTSLILFLTHAPLPQVDLGIKLERWQGALSSAPRFREVPTDPEVRTIAGVVACANLEWFITSAATVLGLMLGAQLRPDFPWLAVSGAPMGGVIVYAFRLRRSWIYLKVLHAQSRPN